MEFLAELHVVSASCSTVAHASAQCRSSAEHDHIITSSHSSSEHSLDGIHRSPHGVRGVRSHCLLVLAQDAQEQTRSDCINLLGRVDVIIVPSKAHVVAVASILRAHTCKHR
jgi:hypothetical protein